MPRVEVRASGSPTFPTLRPVNQTAQAVPAEFHAEVERIRASGTLGRGTQLVRLFEFLVGCRATGRVPKELEVAVDCFERRTDIDVAQDATVRVTAHKLRRRLEEFYRDAGEAPRLTIPRGEYRLALQESPQPLPAGPKGWQRLLPASRREQIAAAVAVFALLVAAVSAGFALRAPSSGSDFAALRASPLWASVLADDLPVQLVLGDYYIFGERDDKGRISRLVRDFNINSRRELERGFITRPEQTAHYADLNLGYLPTSSAQALREVLPVIMAAGKPVMLTLSSELDPATLKTTHAVYLGYMSALGMMQDMVLAVSRYSTGGSYDELVDSVTGEVRVSEAGEPHPPDTRYTDYAYVASLKGPGGHSHLIIAGTRDVGLMQAAEVAADLRHLKELDGRLKSNGPFEALYEVQGVDGINVEAHLLEASPAVP
jgi:hypothetical protein